MKFFLSLFFLLFGFFYVPGDVYASVEKCEYLFENENQRVRVSIQDGVYEFKNLNDPYFKSDYFHRNQIKKTFKKFCQFKKKYGGERFYQDLEKEISKRVGERKAETLARSLPCLVHFPLHILKGMHSIYREQTEDNLERDVWSLHGSNVTISLHSMSALQCVLSGPGFSRLTRLNSKQGMTIAFVGSVLGNTWEEINLPFVENQQSMPIFDREPGKQVQTDEKDFAAGMSATVTYLVGMSLAQKMASGSPGLARFFAPMCK